mmetsp:Transcript_69678/g.145294  ORF Transcript_69678/g.145294 Transcript_69678/m.145294 type:complete len:177 (-) Transcript_69678:262-792(-)
MEFFGCCGGRSKWDDRSANTSGERTEQRTGDQTDQGGVGAWFQSLSGGGASDGGTAQQNGNAESDLTVIKSDHMSQQLVGVGIVFDAGESGRGPGGDGLRVSGLTPKGSAETSKRIRMHDRLAMVDGQDVRTWSARDISPVILGRPGTSVTLGFFSEKNGEYYTVSLARRELHQVI